MFDQIMQLLTPIVSVNLQRITWYGPHYQDLPLVVGDNVFLNDLEFRVSVELSKHNGVVDSKIANGNGSFKSAISSVISTLVVDFLTPKDTGNYTCTMNGIFNRSVNYQLRVLGKICLNY